MTETQKSGTQLEQAIADHLADWERAHVELAIYGTDDPSRIAHAITDFCRHHLDADIDRAIFYQSSIGAVAGLSLHDGRRVVLKAHQPDVPHEQLEEIVSLRTKIARAGGPSPEVLAGPAPLGKGLAIVEEFVSSGMIRDAHEPEVRQALTTSLREIIATLLPFVPQSRLPLRSVSIAPDGILWPAPHSRLFDFEASAGAFAYSVAYSARCSHSIGQDQRAEPGTFQHLIATHGLKLLEL